MSTLREQLYADGEYFRHILSLIPASYCVDSMEHNTEETDTDRAIGGQLLSFCRSIAYILQLCTFVFFHPFRK